MFVKKQKYYLIIENINDINLNNIKKRNKFAIIYRNKKKLEKKRDLKEFRRNCKLKSIDFLIANNLNLAAELNSDGIYLSAHNKSFKALSHKNIRFRIIGSAHSQKEICMKSRQGCDTIIFSKLFVVKYDKYAPILGVIKFNNLLKIQKNLIPLGGINFRNLNKLNQINSKGFALMSEVKKKPAKIFSRLL